uniref:Sulfotransferase n=1 Tax=Oryza punctata TaxID=4537 RepID=A0A0E0MEF2_ORYPU
MLPATKALAGRAGAVPFKDVVVDNNDDGAAIPSQPAAEEYRDIVAALPSRLHGTPQRMRLYQGTWFREDWVLGFIAIQRHFVPREDGSDVVLASLPKCGTTWLKALVFATAARAHPLLRLNPHDCIPFMEAVYFAGDEARLDAAPSPRLMSTHASFTVLPASITENPGCKIIYICRQPKDMLISFWHFINRSKSNAMSFSDVWESIPKGTYFGSPIWEHILEYWKASQEKPDKVLFLKYEEILRDPVKNVEKIAEFIGQPFSDVEKEAGIVESIIDLCSFQSLKASGANNAGFRRVVNVEVPNESFFRKGTVGDWVNYVTPEMAENLDNFLADKFRGSGFSFTK